MEVCAALAILLPAILLLATFLTHWESRISQAALSAEFPFFVSAIENYLRESPAANLPSQVSARQARDGKIDILPAGIGPVDIGLAPLAGMPVVQCHVSGPAGQLNFICSSN
jgi:hypothetical protein